MKKGIALNFEEIKILDQQYVLPTYNRLPMSFARGSGEFLYGHDDKKYIDLLSGIATVSLGHCHPKVVGAITEQAQTLMHTSNLFYNSVQALLAQAIVEKTFFAGKVFFCNSGTEANEAALKIMRAYGQEISPTKTKVIALHQSFHGRSYGGLSLTGQDKVRLGFGPILTDIIHITANSLSELEAAFDQNVCGMIFESVLGEGGVLPLSKEFAQRARALASEHQALLVVDEIQTGAGRSGRVHACEHFDIIPDIITMAKGLGGGLPIGAVYVADAYSNVLKLGMHGSTFGGNHLACAVSKAVWDEVSAPSLLAEVEKKGILLRELLMKLKAEFPFIVEARGLGLMLGIQLSDQLVARDVLIELLERGLVVGTAGGNSLRFVPALTISEQSLYDAYEIMKAYFQTLLVKND